MYKWILRLQLSRECAKHTPDCLIKCSNVQMLRMFKCSGCSNVGTLTPLYLFNCWSPLVDERWRWYSYSPAARQSCWWPATRQAGYGSVSLKKLNAGCMKDCPAQQARAQQTPNKKRLIYCQGIIKSTWAHFMSHFWSVYYSPASHQSAPQAWSTFHLHSNCSPSQPKQCLDNRYWTHTSMFYHQFDSAGGISSVQWCPKQAKLCPKSYTLIHVCALLAVPPHSTILQPEYLCNF